jgi:hypothetical protein
MVDKHIGAVVVMDVSERDYARKVILKGRSSRETKVFVAVINWVIRSQEMMIHQLQDYICGRCRG